MLTAVLTLLAGVLITLLIIAVNGYFVAQEFAYMSVDRNKLRAEAEAGNKTAAKALKITQRTSFMLSGAQLGITVTGLLVGYVAEPLIGQSLGVLFSVAGVPAAVSIAVGTAAALALATIVQMIFGELFPKNYAIANPGPLAKGLATSTRIYLAAFGWLIKIFDAAANALLRLMRIQPVHDVDSNATAEDLEHIVSASREGGELPEDLYLVFDRVLDFPEHDVEHAMIPRSRSDIIQPRTSISQVRHLMSSGHTRYPVIDEEDQPVGVVHMIDLLSTDVPDEADVTELMRPPVILPTVMPLPEAVKKLRQSKAHLACVIDEYGGFAGVVTVEDLAEEILGEITDEHDEHESEEILEVADRRWEADADIHLDEVQRRVGHQLPDGDYETLSGLLMAHAGGLVEAGATLSIELPMDAADYGEETLMQRYLDARVGSVDRHVPAKVTLTLRQQPAQDSEITQ